MILILTKQEFLRKVKKRDDEIAMQLYNQGLSIRNIAAEVNASIGVVHKTIVMIRGES